MFVFRQMMRSLYYEKRVEFIRKFYVPAQKDFPWFTKEDVDAFVEAFVEFDIDRSGGLDVNELVRTAFSKRLRSARVIEFLPNF